LLLRDAIEKIRDEAKKGVHLSCDEMHGHSALGDCLGGDKKDITICQLCEVVNTLLSKIDRLHEGSSKITFRGLP
jgi:hypothetical protein